MGQQNAEKKNPPHLYLWETENLTVSLEGKPPSPIEEVFVNDAGGPEMNDLSSRT